MAAPLSSKQASAGSSGVSTPVKITADSGVITPAPTGNGSSSANSSQVSEASSAKSSQTLPDINGQEAATGQEPEKGSFSAIRNRVIAVANALGFGKGNQVAVDNLTSEATAQATYSGGNINVAGMQQTAQKVGLVAEEQPQKPQNNVKDLSPDILALARGERAVMAASGAAMAASHEVLYAGAAKPQETPATAANLG